MIKYNTILWYYVYAQIFQNRVIDRLTSKHLNGYAYNYFIDTKSDKTHKSEYVENGKGNFGDRTTCLTHAASRSLGQDGPSNWIKLDGHSFQWLVDQYSYPAHWWFQYVSNIFTISFHIFLAVVPSWSGFFWSTGRLTWIPGFNEPDIHHQAAMNPWHAAAIWPEVERVARNYGVQTLVSVPAANDAIFEDLNQYESIIYLIYQLYFNYILQGISMYLHYGWKQTNSIQRFFWGPTWDLGFWTANGRSWRETTHHGR